MTDTKHTPPATDRGRGQQMVRAEPKTTLHADLAGVNADLPEGMEHVSAPLARFMADLRRKMILHELAKCRDAVDDLRGELQ